MRKWSALLIVLAFLFLSNAPAAHAYTNIDFSLSFHDGLRPYGTWVNVSHYGSCWRPSGSFRPYVNGYWEYTDYGPTWIGYEPYAWSVYNYGQWVFDPVYGWIWVPGYEWHSPRVRWAYGADYIGWAPDYAGFDYSNINLWVFINRSNFGYRNYSGVVLRRDSIQNLFDRRVVRVRSGSLQRTELERIVGRPVRVSRVRERTILADGHRTRLIVPEGHDEILKHVSSMSKNRGNSEKQKVTTTRKVEVKHDSHGKSVHESKSKVHTESKPTVKYESRSKSVHQDSDRDHGSSKTTVKHESRSNPVSREKTTVHGSSKAKPESGKSHNQSPERSSSTYNKKSQGHSSGSEWKSDGRGKPETRQQKSGKSRTSSKSKNHSKQD